MKMLTSEITKLLDRLYNLRGSESVVLAKMEKEKITATETKERTTSEKATLQSEIENLTEEERVLAEEGEKLLTTLSRIKTEDFKTVLTKLNVDFNPERLSEDVNRMLPKTIERVQNEKDAASKKLVQVETDLNTAIATIEELGIRKDEALEDQRRLNEYFDLALSGNINITRDSITSLLEKFDFNEDEQREAAKLMRFPEDALFEYENRLQFAEAKDAYQNNDEGEEKSSLSPKDNLINLLTELGFDYLDFTANDIDKILANYNETDLRKNVEIAHSHDMKLDFFVDNVELLYDKELDEKIKKLIEIGKEPFDIYLNPNILMKYDINGLDEAVMRLQNSGLDPKIVPLIAY